MCNFYISFMEQNYIQKSAQVLSIAMLNNPHHIGVFLAKEDEKIIGVMRMKSCIGKAIDDPDVFDDENDINWRKTV